MERIPDERKGIIPGQPEEQVILPREIQLGLTLIGPHHDELSLSIDGKPARTFASEGQKKPAWRPCAWPNENAFAVEWMEPL